MTRLALIRGLPGSGKSTLAKQFWDDGFRHFENDMFFVGEDNVYRYDPTRIAEANAWCFVRTVKWLNDGFDVVVSNTFTRRWELTSYLIIAQALHVKVTLIRTIGEYGSIHGVPDDVMQTMRDRWEDIDSVWLSQFGI